MKYQDGSWYKGQWLNNHAHGFGEMRFVDGGIYRGEWKKGIF